MKKLLFSGFLLCSLVGFANEKFQVPVLPIDGIELSEEWKEYTTIDGVKIEYRMKRCETDKMRAQNLLLFRFTNTNDREVVLSWVAKEFRNDACWNCEVLYDGDFNHRLVLSAGEVIEGDGTTKENKEVYIFGNFIKHVPGMMEQTLTSFELVDLKVR